MAKKEEPVPIKFPPNKKLARLFAKALEIAMELPGVEESRSYGTPAIKVKGKILARLRSEAEGGLAILCDFPERESLMEADPSVFYVTDHYADWPMVLINLEKVPWDMMPSIIEDGWRRAATAKLQKELEAKRSG